MMGLEFASTLPIWSDSVSYGGPQTVEKVDFNKGVEKMVFFENWQKNKKGFSAIQIRRYYFLSKSTFHHLLCGAIGSVHINKPVLSQRTE